jgi:ribosomal protein S18 acetylase RimI-like enzyme
MPFLIRPYHPSDLPQLYRICLKTAHYGRDGSHLFVDLDLMGHFFIGPYAALEPDLCFVLLERGRPMGYICATRDVPHFRDACERLWFPPLRQQYSLEPPIALSADEQELYRIIHAGIDLNDDVKDYPARLHIALLPEVQRRGGGRQLMKTLSTQLQTLGVTALHLEVSSQNEGAIAFYEAVGFHRVVEYPGALMFGQHLR